MKQGEGDGGSGSGSGGDSDNEGEGDGGSGSGSGGDSDNEGEGDGGSGSGSGSEGDSEADGECYNAGGSCSGDGSGSGDGGGKGDEEHESDIRSESSGVAASGSSCSTSSSSAGSESFNGDQHLEGVSLCVVGESGVGKSSFMAGLAQSLFESDQRTCTHRALLFRSCGTTSAFSTDGLNLVQSLVTQIKYVYALDAEAPLIVPENAHADYPSIVEEFRDLMGQYPVVLFLDAVDQLSNNYLERSELSFLKGLQLHTLSRVIVSCLPDTPGAIDSGKQHYSYQCDTKLNNAGVPRVTVGSFQDSAGSPDEAKMEAILSTKLKTVGRKLTSEQMAIALASMRVEPKALYIVLAHHVVQHWKSSDDPGTCVLAPTIPGILSQIFDRLESQYGRMVTRACVGLITFSEAGVSDVEMQDLLSLMDEVLDDTFQYSTLESVRRLPMHVWLLLKLALGELLVERESNCSVWCHRQLWECLPQRYSPSETLRLHTLLAKYFGNLVETSLVQSQLITVQPLVLSAVDVWQDTCVVNRRRVIEAANHMRAAGETLWRAAVQEMCCLAYVCACLRAGEGYRLLYNMYHVKQLLNATQAPDAVQWRGVVDDYFFWLRKSINVIIPAEDVAEAISRTVAELPAGSHVRRDMLELLCSLD
jgi:hypothetical protein